MAVERSRRKKRFFYPEDPEEILTRVKKERMETILRKGCGPVIGLYFEGIMDKF